MELKPSVWYHLRAGNLFREQGTEKYMLTEVKIHMGRKQPVSGGFFETTRASHNCCGNDNCFGKVTNIQGWIMNPKNWKKAILTYPRGFSSLNVAIIFLILN